MERIYFDHSATTPVDERVVVAMNEAMLEEFGNPSSIHSFGQRAKAVLDKARGQVARLLNAAPDEIYFTSGGTEADNIALIGTALHQRARGGHIVISDIEHAAVRASALELERQGFSVSRVKPDRLGQITPDAVRECMRPDTILVSVMHCNNEFGTINDIAAISKVAHSYGALFHTDAVQSFGKIPIDTQTMNIDLLSLSGHKIYGPKGIGALFIRKGVRVIPRQFGGHQESGIRPGTENVGGIVGLGRAAEICSKEMSSEGERLTGLRNELLCRIEEELDGVTLNGHPEKRLPGNLNLTFHGVEGEAFLIALDMEGIAVSTGSACSSGSAQPSQALLALGLSPEEANSTIRFSLGRSNTDQDIAYAAKIIVDAVRRLRAMTGVRAASVVSH